MADLSGFGGPIWAGVNGPALLLAHRHSWAVKLHELPASDPRPLLSEERSDLLVLLDGLSDEEWLAPSESGHWRVKDVALHLLDDDLGWLSRGRDADLSSLLSTDMDYRDFVRALDAKNERWVQGAFGLSRKVITDLLRWSGDQVADFYASLDLGGSSNVIWAAEGGVPRWFDLCRDLTERWVHQQHIRDAVGRTGDHDRFLPVVLGTFVWAFPHQYVAEAAPDTRIHIGLGTGGDWSLTREGDGWELDRSTPDAPAATIQMSDAAGWRQLTGLPTSDGIQTSGPPGLVDGLLRVRGIIV